MRIEWNKVTWYSKLLAVIIFATAYFLGFYFGIIYEKERELSSNQTQFSSTTKPY